jgi:hypothetical protein
MVLLGIARITKGLKVSFAKCTFLIYRLETKCLLGLFVSGLYPKVCDGWGSQNAESD